MADPQATLVRPATAGGHEALVTLLDRHGPAFRATLAPRTLTTLYRGLAYLHTTNSWRRISEAGTWLRGVQPAQDAADGLRMLYNRFARRSRATKPPVIVSARIQKKT